VLVRQAKAPGRVGPSDSALVVGAVDAVDGIPEIESASALGVLKTAGHSERQAGDALVHFRRRRPRRPRRYAADALRSGPCEAVAAD